MADSNDTSIAPLIETPSSEAKRSKSWGRGGYGANAAANASSDLPGQRTRAALTVNHDDSDPVLNAIKANGSKVANGQTREYTNEQKVPTTFGHRSRSGE